MLFQDTDSMGNILVVDGLRYMVPHSTLEAYVRACAVCVWGWIRGGEGYLDHASMLIVIPIRRHLSKVDVQPGDQLQHFSKFIYAVGANIEAEVIYRLQAVGHPMVVDKQQGLCQLFVHDMPMRTAVMEFFFVMRCGRNAAGPVRGRGDA